MNIKKLCGVCAQKAETSLKDRLQLAFSREKGVVYDCPGCGKQHSIDSKPYEQKTAETGENAEIREARESFVQTSLF
jgi:predicted RNA-binding Zn-ribbon protein involved in translation (DUF1610 family)